MADQNQIDTSSELIAELVDKAREELITDLHRLGLEVDNIDAFATAMLELDIEGTLKAKLQKATAVYADAHRQVLETTIGFAEISSNTLSTFAQLNEKMFDQSIINTISGHIRTEVIKGVQAGMSASQIAQQVSSASISNAQMQTLVNTTLNSYSRTITNQMMDIAPDSTKYVYIGPADEKTRPECLKYINAGRLTEKEIKSKGDKWKESLVKGGGFNCRHKWEIAAEGGSNFHESKEAKELNNA